MPCLLSAPRSKRKEHTAKPMPEPGPESYCREEVKRHDRDRYITAIFAPAAARRGLFALYAFNQEVARTAEVVSEPTLGQIRLQWWRDAIDEVFAGQPREHIVVQELAALASKVAVSRDDFAALLTGREADLSSDPPADLPSLERYLEATSASVMRLAMQVLGVPLDELGTKSARHLGIAWGMIGLLRAVPFHAAQKRIYLPQDHLFAAGVKLPDLFELRGSDAVDGVAMRLAKRADEHLQEGRGLAAKLPSQALSALLPTVLTGRYLQRLEQADYNVFAQSFQQVPPARIWWLLPAVWRGRV